MASNIHELEESLWSHIWIPGDMEPDEIVCMATCLQNCNKGLDDWLRGKITTEDYFDICEQNGHVMDGYIATVEDNLEVFFEV